MSILAQASNEPITHKDQLIEYFRSGEKPRENWRIGSEHEKFPYRLSTLKPVAYDERNGMRDFMVGMQAYGWQPVMEGQNIIGLTRDNTAVSFEPGCQIELAGAPLLTLHEVAAETEQHLREVNEVGAKLDIGFLGMGFHPTAKREDIPWVPKERYRIMRAYMPKRGSMGLDMMVRTCTTQVNLDFSSEADMVKKFRVGLALQPVITALFATSPFKEGKPSGFNSMRMNVWTDTDNDRSGPIPFAFEDGFGYERYVDYALAVPMYFVYRNGKYIDCAGQSFRDFLQGKLPALPGELPTMTDWANHLTTLFPDVRLKKIIEMRGGDVGSRELIQALPSIWVGLLYDDASLDAARDLTKKWTAEDRVKLHDDIPRLGFKAELRGQKLTDVAMDVLAIAKEGLQHRGHDEAKYLDILFEYAERGENRADQLLAGYKKTPDFMGQKLFNVQRL